MPTIPIYIDMDQEIEELLASNGLTIQEIIHRERIDASVKFGSMPYADDKHARTKDIATIIMATGASVYLISKAITKILHELRNKPIYDSYYELEPVKDAGGNILMNEKTGDPIMLQTKRHFVFEPGKNQSEQSEVSAGIKGLVMKFSSKQ